ncbi:uncharacterized protein LOC141619495 [Silene latifolia]|uniref:uncharacterized protein LOC141619495 n=1 Tax=Silene latifolia TaxID=37657 RepID=UPI003D7723F9
MNSIQRPFRFQAAWLTHEKFSEFVENSWPSGDNLVSQLSNLSTKLTNWNETVFGNIFRQKRELKARIAGCQRELSLNRQRHLIKLESKLRKELEEVLEREELLWYQKSRVEFIKDGDQNTSYFHVSTLVRRWRNKINSLKDDNGEWVHNKEEVKRIVVEYYRQLYTEEAPHPVEDAADIPYDVFQD